MTQQPTMDINKLNSFLDYANQAISCDSECKQNKRSTSLRNKLMEAESNLVLAEPEYQNAMKKYYVYVSGKTGYEEMMQEKYTEMATQITDTMKEYMTEISQQITQQINTYKGLMVNVRNLVDLFRQYKTENKHLARQLKEDANDIITNERKTYYEDQEIDVLDTYYYILFIIYIIVAICFIVLYYKNGTGSKILTLLTFILLVGLPFLSYWGLRIVLFILFWLFSLFPKNVYTTL